MRKFKILSLLLMSGLLLACQNNQAVDNIQSVNDKDNNINHNTVISRSKPLTIDEQLALLIQNTWQFEKGENIIDKNLKLLDGKIIINFAKSTQRGEMHDPDYDLNYQYHFSVDAGCNHNSSIVGFDKITNKVVEIKTMSFSTLVGCYPDHETTIQHFIKNDNISYQVNENQLLFRDDNNQTLFFKKKQ